MNNKKKCLPVVCVVCIRHYSEMWVLLQHNGHVET